MRTRRPDKDGEIIVKRRGKKRHEEEPGGAWKVAFADFTLAMMALFMVLWIVQPVGKYTEAARNEGAGDTPLDGDVGMFDAASRTPLEMEGLELPVPQRKAEDSVKRYGSPDELRQLAQIMRTVALEVGALANLEVNVVPQGLRILIKDDAQRFMFERGSAVLDPRFKELLEALAHVLVRVDNKLIISGHTDATPYRSTARYDNWHLSGDRAQEARRVMVAAGLPAQAVLQVTAQADVMPLRPEDPYHGVNRRIEILLLTESAEELYRKLFGESYTQVHYATDGSKLRLVEE